MTTSLALLALTALLAILTPHSSVSAQPAPGTRFRTAVDLVTVDVTVIDGEGRPVSGLTAEDFEVRVDGSTRRVVSSQFMTADSREETSSTPRAAESPIDPGSSGRRFVFAVDRASMPFGHGRQVLDAAARFVDGLSPADRAAVWVLPESRGRLIFTHDRHALKRLLAGAFGTGSSPPEAVRMTPAEAMMIDLRDPATTRVVVARECAREGAGGIAACETLVRSVASRAARDGRLHGQQVMDALKDLARALAPLESPTHVVFVTDGVMQHRDVMPPLHEAADAAALGRVHVHALQPWSRAWLNPAERPGPEASSADVTAAFAGASSLAAMTGGYAATYVAPHGAFTRLALELSAGYLLAFEPQPGDRDGRVHTIDVRAPGRHLTVRARQRFRIDSQAPVTADRPLCVDAATYPSHAGLKPCATMTEGGEPTTPAPEAVARRLDAGSGETDTARPATESDLAGLLVRMRAYVAGVERELASVVLEERYVQIAKPWTRPPRGPEHEAALAWSEVEASRSRTIVFASRRLLSDVLLVQTSDDMWVGYRDVFEADGKLVRQRDDRLKRLFLSPSTTKGDDLFRISRESARYNLGRVVRTINVPTFPLLYLHPRHANHMRFSHKGVEDLDGRSCAVVEFDEVGKPTLVGTLEGGHVRAWGRVWVEPDSGRVRRIEARVEPGRQRQAVRVTFAEHPGMDVLVPREMWEWYERSPIVGQGNDLMIEALATYSNVRRFTVSTSEWVAPR